MNFGNINTGGARYVAHLDSLTRKLTAFASFAELVNAKGDYRPTLVTTDDGVQLANAYDFEQRRRGSAKRVEFRPVPKATTPHVEIVKEWDENERVREGRNGRVYVSSGRSVWVVLVNGEVRDSFERRYDAREFVRKNFGGAR